MSDRSEEHDETIREESVTHYTFTKEQLHELLWQVGGAATAPLMQDHGDYEFPSERVNESINNCLKSFDLPTREVSHG